MFTKKQRNNLLITSIITSICILSLCGCSEYNNPEAHNVTETDATTTNAATYSNGDRYVKELSKNVTVDASVKIPNVDKIPIINGTKVEFDAEKVKEILLPNEELSKIIYENEDSTSHYESNDGKMLNVKNGSILYSKDMKNYAKDIYNLSNCSKWTEDDLSFMTKKDATNLVLDYCEKLGIKINKTPLLIKSLNYDLLKEQEIEVKKDETFNAFIEMGKIKPKELTKDDELYIMEFNTNMEEVDLISKGFTLQTVDRGINGSKIEAVISKEGLVSFGTETVLYAEESIKEEDSSRISLDDAVKKVSEKYDGILSDDKIKITNISLEYTPNITSDSNSKVELIPTWVFDMTINGIDTKTNENFENEKSIYINAITGEEII